MPVPNATSLEKAIAALERAMNYFAEVHPNNPACEHARSAVVLNFQIVLELSLLFMRRFADADAESANRNSPLNVGGILDIAEKEGLIDSAKRWMAHRKLRNITSHAYNEEKADRVAEDAAALLADAKAFAARLRARAEAAE